MVSATGSFGSSASSRIVTRPVIEHELVSEIHAVLSDETPVAGESGSEADVEQ